MPGTFNFKQQDNPRAVITLWIDGPKHSYQDFELIAAEYSQPKKISQNTQDPAQIGHATHQQIKAVQVDGQISNFDNLKRQPVGLPYSPSQPHALLSGSESRTTAPPGGFESPPRFLR